MSLKCGTFFSIWLCWFGWAPLRISHHMVDDLVTLFFMWLESIPIWFFFSSLFFVLFRHHVFSLFFLLLRSERGNVDHFFSYFFYACLCVQGVAFFPDARCVHNYIQWIRFFLFIVFIHRHSIPKETEERFLFLYCLECCGERILFHNKDSYL